MNEAEYFRQAFHDADFRRQKIREQREQKKLFKGFFIFGAVIMAAFTASLGLAEGKWLLSVSTYFSTLVIPAILYSTARTRLAALEAMEGKAAIPNDKSVPATAN